MPPQKTGTKVFSISGPRWFQYSVDERLEMRESRSAMEIFHAIQRLHEKFYLMEDPEGYTVEMPFPEHPTFWNVSELFAVIESRLRGGWIADVSIHPRVLRETIDEKLKLLFLHLAYQRGWEVSGIVGCADPGQRRYRLPLSLLCDQEFRIGGRWAFASFEDIQFTDLQFHCHRVDQKDTHFARYPEVKVAQELPELLSIKKLTASLKQSFPETSGRFVKTVARIKNENLLNFYPTTFDAANADEIYRLNNAPKMKGTPGRPSDTPIIMPAFLQLAETWMKEGEIKGVTLSTALNAIRSELQKRAPHSDQRVPSIDTIDNTLKSKMFWKDRSWNEDAILRALEEQPAWPSGTEE